MDLARPWIALPILLALVASPGVAAARSILVVGPHPDDETLLGAGRTREAVLAGDTVHVVVVTNGDVNGPAEGLRRQAESVAAAAVLGVLEEDVVFLGYGDQVLHKLWSSSSGTQIFASQSGQATTYGSRGLGGMDFHRHRTGSPGAYTRDTVLGDFKALIATFRPDEIYTVNRFDNHGDHSATAKFLHEALLALKREGADVRVTLYESVVWAPFANGGCWGDWPPAGAGPLPYPPFPPPPCVGPGTPLDWDMIRRVAVPQEMQRRDPTRNLKWRALEAYRSQFSDFLSAFVRKDEFYWRYDYGTLLSPLARISVSSENRAGGGAKEHAVDGYADIDHEWKSAQSRGAWLQLDWPAPVRVGEVILQDRIDPADNVIAGTLTFSDGSSIPVPPLPKGGKPVPIAFAPRVTTCVRFDIDRAEGHAPGLAEFQVLGVPAAFSGNIPPHIIRGPSPGASSISTAQTVALSVEAHDLDGDAVRYEWSADGGTVVGRGPSAVFTPPPVRTPVTFTVTVRVTGSGGGEDRNSAFVMVTPAGADEPEAGAPATPGSRPVTETTAATGSSTPGATFRPATSPPSRACGRR